jgi:hypothetical protein
VNGVGAGGRNGDGAGSEIGEITYEDGDEDEDEDG